MPLRQYQVDVQSKIIAMWESGKRHVMPVLPTGSGKTKIMADTARYKTPGTYGLAAAHRGELVGQISCALAAEGLQHNIIASKKVVRSICEDHMERFGRVLFNPSADWMVAGVDTLLRRDMSALAGRISMAFMDEAHHVTQYNKWGKVVGMFDKANWMLPTATPERADGQGLGAHASGFVDAVVEGPRLRWMTDNGYLVKANVRVVKTEDLDLSDVKDGSDGDVNQNQLRAATKKSRKIVGNIVRTYCENTPGMLGIVFAVDREHGEKIAQDFNAAGVTAEFVSGEDDEAVRRDKLRRYRNRETLVLVNVDLFGEGFDLPKIEVVMFGRFTKSYSLYVQQWGRGLRLDISDILQAAWDTYTPEQRLRFIAESDKPVAHIHDHVGNMAQFKGPPTVYRQVDLDDRKRRVSSGTIPTRLCSNDMCNERYERSEPVCPFCNTEPPPPNKPKSPEEVDGDLELMTDEMLRERYEAQEAYDNYRVGVPANASYMVTQRAERIERERKLAQEQLRKLIAMFMPKGEKDRKAQRKFFHLFGVDVLAAKALVPKDADKLAAKIRAHIRGES